MYGHDISRTGTTACPQAPSTASASRLVPRWFFHADDVVTASPAIVQGMVYVGDWNGRFYALDLKTGSVHWSTRLGRGRTDGNADLHTGAYGEITSSAAVTTLGRRRVIFVGGRGSMYALDASRDNVPDAQRVLWRFDVDPAHPTNHGEIESSPVVWTGAPGGPVVMFGSDSNQDSGFTGEGVWAVRADTGRLAWHFNPETATGQPLYGCGNVWSSRALGLDPRNPPTSDDAPSSTSVSPTARTTHRRLVLPTVRTRTAHPDSSTTSPVGGSLSPNPSRPCPLRTVPHCGVTRSMP
jgi:polyvinyl alcohol dehydrogenase (cytochrome)